ncbi:MAG: hypothetical protein HY672_02580 [Chloroflexi bacterium]|nr:hypothetical protein [Chloroflexota bacterium]
MLGIIIVGAIKAALMNDLFDRAAQIIKKELHISATSERVEELWESSIGAAEGDFEKAWATFYKRIRKRGRSGYARG